MTWIDTTDNHLRDKRTALLRGFFGRCPNCGRGHLFRAYLKVVDECPLCGEEYHHHRADDAPAYFVIFIVGHLVVPLTLSLEIALAPPYWVHALLWGPLTLGLALALLPRIKGTIVAWQWANYMHGFEAAARRPVVCRAAKVRSGPAR
ncbi:MAG TPA: DUF983 domain-containing protein [Xanthobacteraceae bacterium]|nr:DUF983 domain-containing protein [Xanthobacteraceae bacterium]